MLGDINRNLEPINYELILCKPDKTQIGVLNVEDLSIDFRFPTTDELTFSIYLGENYYDIIKGDYLILLNEEKYFIIDNPEEVGNGIEVKNIHCYSLEYMLNKKNIRGYKLVSRKLYSTTYESDDDGFQLGVMNYVKTITSWKLDTNSFLEFDGIGSKYRSFDISEKSLFEFLIKDVQEAYECIFLFDTLTKTISVKAIDQLQGNKGLYISEGNYIKSINKKIKNDEIKTRLYCYGKDISIADINPTGMPYIENYTFYKHLDFMSQDLIGALNEYENNLDFNSLTYSNLLNDLNILRGELDVLFVALSDSKTVLNIAQNNLDLAIKNNESLTQVNIELTNAENDVSSNQLLVNNKQGEIDLKYVEISNYQLSINISNYLNTEDLISEFDNFIKETTWSDTNYTNSTDLLEEGKKKLLKLSTPPLTFDIEIVDFLQIIDCQHDWDKLIIGDIVSVEFEKFGIDIEVRLVGYTHKPKDNSLGLIFSNKDAIDNPNIYLTDLISNAITSSNTLSYNKNDWDNKANSSVITELRNENIDASLKQIMASKNQSQTIDGRGIWLKEIDDNGIVSPEQLRIISNSIVISQDNWQTASTAISAQGVNASTFWGKTVIANEGLFDGIDIFDGGQSPVVEVGKYFTGATEKKGIRINGGNFEIVPPVGVTSNGISLTPTDGLIIQKRNDSLFQLTNQTILNATDGFKMQKNIGTFLNPIWENKLYMNSTTGDINYGGKLVATDGTLGIITGGKIQDINGTKTVIDLTNGTMRFGVSDTNFKLKFDGTNLIIGGGSITWGTGGVNPPTASQVGALPVGWTQDLSNYVTSGTLSSALSNYLTSSQLYTQLGYDYIVTGKIAANQVTAGALNGFSISTWENNNGMCNISGNQIYGQKSGEILYNLRSLYENSSLYYGGLDIYRKGNYGNNRSFTIGMTNFTSVISTSYNTPLEIRPNISSFGGSSDYNENSRYVGLYGGLIIGSTYNSIYSFAPIQNGLMVQGNVAIGKNTANYKLDVVGDINLTGHIYINGVLFQ